METKGHQLTTTHFVKHPNTPFIRSSINFGYSGSTYLGAVWKLTVYPLRTQLAFRHGTTRGVVLKIGRKACTPQYFCCQKDTLFLGCSNVLSRQTASLIVSPCPAWMPQYQSCALQVIDSPWGSHDVPQLPALAPNFRRRLGKGCYGHIQ